MGKASSSKKVARASRAAGRPGAKKSLAWPFAIGGVVILGVALVVLSFGGGSKVDKGAPQPGVDHWHAAYGVYACDHYIAPLTDAGSDTTGIHTHGEGLMHIHPFTSTYGGKGANVGAFMKDTGSKLTDTSISVKGAKFTNGDKCNGVPGRLELLHWDKPTDAAPKVLTSNLNGYAPKDQSVWVLAFVAPGTKVPLPPSAANLVDPLAVEQGRQPAQGGTPSSTTPTTSASTTIPPGDSSTTAKP
jgi:hypothetical protein